MNRSVRLLPGTAALLLLLGCGTAPAVHYYELSLQKFEASPGRSPVELVVAQVRVPDSLDRTEMVVQKNENESEVLDFEQWLSPLTDQLNRAVVADLQAELPDFRVTQGRLPAGLNKRLTLDVDVVRVTVERKEKVTLQASWVVMGDARNELVRDRGVIDVPLGGQGYQAVAPAMSLAVSLLTKRIAAGVVRAL
jgi:uncharacterized protein